MANLAIPKAAPTSAGQWLNDSLSWLYINVFWGALAILLGTFFPMLSGESPLLPDDSTLAITVLAITLCATQTEFPRELKIREHIQQLWLGRAALIVCVFGAVIAAVSTGSSIIDHLKLDKAFLLNTSLYVFAFAILIGYWAFVLRTKATDDYIVQIIKASREAGGYAEEINDDKRNISEQAKTENEVAGVRL
jgi:hypothetical protein